MSINPSEESIWSFWIIISVGDCKIYLGFLSQTFVFLESVSLPFHTCVSEPYLGTLSICREIKSTILVKVLSVSCLHFTEMFSARYGKCILPIYPNWNIRQVWKFNILCENHIRQAPCPFKYMTQRNLS